MAVSGVTGAMTRYLSGVRTVCLILTFSLAGYAADIKVVTSGAFTAPFIELAPQYERASQNKVITLFGASMGTTPDTIPRRLERGEDIDVVIMAAPTLDELIRQGKVRSEGRVDLVRSLIAMAVRTGTPKPDISKIEGLKRALLAATSIAYSGSASGVYLSTELFPKLGIANQIKGKTRQIEGEPVGAVVARGEAEIGFQQMSELLPVKGIDIVGPLPEGAQRITVFAAGVPVTSKQPEAAMELIRWLASDATSAVISRSGLDPVKAAGAAQSLGSAGK
jgi:molybdate transport system substrate-binding protein